MRLRMTGCWLLLLVVTCLLVAIGCSSKDDDGGDDDDNNDDDDQDDDELEVTLPSGVVVRIDLDELTAMALPFPVEDLTLNVATADGTPVPGAGAVDLGGAYVRIGPEAEYYGRLNLHVEIPEGLVSNGTSPWIVQYDDENQLWYPKASVAERIGDSTFGLLGRIPQPGLFGVFSFQSEADDNTKGSSRILIDGVEVSLPAAIGGELTITARFKLPATFEVSLNGPSFPEYRRNIVNQMSWSESWNPSKEGKYTLTFSNGRTIVWQQTIQIGDVCTSSTCSSLAEQYVPVVSFATGERYCPVVLNDDYFEPVGISVFPDSVLKEISGSEAARFVATHGNNEAYLSRRSDDDFEWQEETCNLSQTSTTAYWTAQEAGDFLYLTYWLFFQHDPKYGLMRFANHDRDRESVTVILRKDGVHYDPHAVWYFQHRSNQNIQMQRPGINPRWEGSLAFLWKDVDLDQTGKHPVIYLAEGSHAVFPRAGTYEVIGGFGFDEPAGGGVTHCPDDAVLFDGCNRSLRLRPFGTWDQLSFNQSWKHVSFPGIWVKTDLQDELFPPFVDRFDEIPNWNRTPHPHPERFPDASHVGGEITSPSNGASVVGEFMLAGDATDTDNLEKVTIALNWGEDGHKEIEACNGNCQGETHAFSARTDPEALGLGIPSGASVVFAIWTEDELGYKAGPFDVTTITWNSESGDDDDDTGDDDDDTGDDDDDDTGDDDDDESGNFADTGQTLCYDASGEMTCPASGEDYYGQDAQYGPNVMTFIPGGDGTVYHLDTGLTWDTSVFGLMYDWQDAQDECAGSGVGGYEDWRLPTRYELMTIVDYSQDDPAINGSVFPGTPSDGHWTLDTYAGDSEYAWYVEFDEGGAGYDEKLNDHYVRCVRGDICTRRCGGRECGRDGCGGDCGFCADGEECSLDGQCVVTSQAIWPWSDSEQTVCFDDETVMACPAEGESFYGQDAQYQNNPLNFTARADGTVKDNNTGYRWQRFPVLTAATWTEAVTYCDALDMGGHDDWRLPTRWEFVTIIDYGHFGEAIDPQAFHGTGNEEFWSANEYAGNNDFAWYVDFTDGAAGYADKTSQFRVRCVVGELECRSNCGSRECGLDECGHDCGFCDVGLDCTSDGQCVESNRNIYPWPDSDQLMCFDNETVMECPLEGESFYGQDAQYLGNVLSYSSVAEGTVYDNVTGFTWQRFPELTESAHEEAVTYCDTLDLAGFDDWRLPTRWELVTIVDYAHFGEAVNQHAFRGTGNEEFWTSNIYAGDDSFAWYVDFTEGAAGYAANTSEFSVRCVRGGLDCRDTCDGYECGTDACGHDCGFCAEGYTCLDNVCELLPRTGWPFSDSGQRMCFDNETVMVCPDPEESYFGQDAQYLTNWPSYTALGGGVVMDNVTGLLWERYFDTGQITWVEAGSYCSSLVLGGLSNWRLPLREELVSIVDYEHFGAAIDSHAFPGVGGEEFWTTFEYAGDSDYAWMIDFTEGSAEYVEKTTLLWVRCVHD